MTSHSTTDLQRYLEGNPTQKESFTFHLEESSQTDFRTFNPSAT
jgi:hypothetical protein